MLIHAHFLATHPINKVINGMEQAYFMCIFEFRMEHFKRRAEVTQWVYYTGQATGLTSVELWFDSQYVEKKPLLQRVQADSGSQLASYLTGIVSFYSWV